MFAFLINKFRETGWNLPLQTLLQLLVILLAAVGIISDITHLSLKPKVSNFVRVSTKLSDRAGTLRTGSGRLLELLSIQWNGLIFHNWGEPAWASPTLADYNAKRVCMYVCLCVAIIYTENLNWANGFQICSLAWVHHVQWTNSTPMKARLRTLTDKGRLLIDGTVKSRTVLAFASGKGHA